ETLDADVAAPPVREELAVERVETLELEGVVGEEYPAAHGPPDRRRDPLRREEVRERAEVEGQLARAGLARPGERLDHEELGQAVRGIRAAAHRTQRPAAAADASSPRRGREMEETPDAAFRVLRESKHGAGDME